MKALMLRTPAGFTPADDEARDSLKHIKLGDFAWTEVTRARNIRFHRKYFALLNIAFDHWSECCEPMLYNGQPVLPSFDVFRKEITILAGYYTASYSVNGDVKVDAKSISFASMGETEFSQLYDKTITVLVNKVLKSRHWTEQKLRQVVDSVMEFA